jgi:hypothetical protein
MGEHMGDGHHWASGMMGMGGWSGQGMMSWR